MYEHMQDDGNCVFWSKDLSKNFIKHFDDCANNLGRKAIIVVGDSHTMNIYNALAKTHLSPFLVSISKGGCRPYNSKPDCQYDQFLDFVSQRSDFVERVIFHQSGSYLLADSKGRTDSSKAFVNSNSFTIMDQPIDKIIIYLEKISLFSRVIWLGTFVESRVSFKQEPDWENLKFNNNSILAFNSLDQFIINKLAHMPKRFMFVPINPRLSVLFPYLVHGDCLIVRDIDHLSRCGEEIVGRLIKDIVERSSESVTQNIE